MRFRDFFVIAFLFVGQARADIIYQLVNNSDFQGGYTLSGFITTNGTIGALKDTDFLSWSVTIESPVSSFTFFSNPGSTVLISEEVIATGSEIYLPSFAPVGNGYSSLSLHDLAANRIIWGEDVSLERVTNFSVCRHVT